MACHHEPTRVYTLFAPGGRYSACTPRGILLLREELLVHLVCGGVFRYIIKQCLHAHFPLVQLIICLDQIVSQAQSKKRQQLLFAKQPSMLLKFFKTAVKQCKRLPNLFGRRFRPERKFKA